MARTYTCAKCRRTIPADSPEAQAQWWRHLNQCQMAAPEEPAQPG